MPDDKSIDSEHATAHGESLEEAAEEGPLPGIEEIDEATKVARDDSETADPDDEADAAGGGVIVGGINSH